MNKQMGTEAKSDENDMPMLSCPNCDEELIPPSSRGLYDEDGVYIKHRDNCRCSHCTWMWFDDAPTVVCACGARVFVSCDGEYAYAELEEKP